MPANHNQHHQTHEYVERKVIYVTTVDFCTMLQMRMMGACLIIIGFLQLSSAASAYRHQPPMGAWWVGLWAIFTGVFAILSCTLGIISSGVFFACVGMCLAVVGAVFDGLYYKLMDDLTTCVDPNVGVTGTTYGWSGLAPQAAQCAAQQESSHYDCYCVTDEADNNADGSFRCHRFPLYNDDTCNFLIEREPELLNYSFIAIILLFSCSMIYCCLGSEVTSRAGSVRGTIVVQRYGEARSEPQNVSVEVVDSEDLQQDTAVLGSVVNPQSSTHSYRSLGLGAIEEGEPGAESASPPAMTLSGHQNGGSVQMIAHPSQINQHHRERDLEAGEVTPSHEQASQYQYVTTTTTTSTVPQSGGKQQTSSSSSLPAHPPAVVGGSGVGAALGPDRAIAPSAASAGPSPAPKYTSSHPNSSVHSVTHVATVHNTEEGSGDPAMESNTGSSTMSKYASVSISDEV